MSKAYSQPIFPFGASGVYGQQQFAYAIPPSPHQYSQVPMSGGILANGKVFGGQSDAGYAVPLPGMQMFPPPPPGFEPYQQHGYHPSLTPIVEHLQYATTPQTMNLPPLPPYLTKTPIRHSYSSSNASQRSTSSGSSQLRASAPVFEPRPGHSAGSSVASLPVLGMSTSTSTSNPNGFSSPATSQSSTSTQERNKAAEVQRLSSLRELTLTPFDDSKGMVEIMIEDSHAQKINGGVPRVMFQVHHKLLSHFSPVFKTYLATLDASEAKASDKVKSKSVGIKAYNYNNELDFNTRHEAGPADLPLMTAPLYASDQNPGKCKDGVPTLFWEDSTLFVPVKVSLPGMKATSPPPPSKPRQISLPPQVGVVKPETFDALLRWLYLAQPGQAFPPPGFEKSCSTCTLIELWVLAGRLGITACQNDVAIGIEKSRQAGGKIETGMLKWIWENTAEYDKVKEPSSIHDISEGKIHDYMDGGSVVSCDEDSGDDHSRGSSSPTIKAKGKMMISKGQQQNDNNKKTNNNNTSNKGCPLRNLLIDQCAWCLDETWLKGVGSEGLENEKIFPRQVLVDVLCRLRELHRDGGYRAEGGDELKRIELRLGERYWVEGE